MRKKCRKRHRDGQEDVRKTFRVTRTTKPLAFGVKISSRAMREFNNHIKIYPTTSYSFSSQERYCTIVNERDICIELHHSLEDGGNNDLLCFELRRHDYLLPPHSTTEIIFYSSTTNIRCEARDGLIGKICLRSGACFIIEKPQY